jgi:hypothetical protein
MLAFSVSFSAVAGAEFCTATPCAATTSPTCDTEVNRALHRALRGV